MLQFSLACVRDSEKSTGVYTKAIWAIFCDSKKSRFNFVCKADLLIREGRRDNLKTPSRKNVLFGMLILAGILF